MAICTFIINVLISYNQLLKLVNFCHSGRFIKDSFTILIKVSLILRKLKYFYMICNTQIFLWNVILCLLFAYLPYGLVINFEEFFRKLSPLRHECQNSSHYVCNLILIMEGFMFFSFCALEFISILYLMAPNFDSS